MFIGALLLKNVFVAIWQHCQVLAIFYLKLQNRFIYFQSVNMSNVCMCVNSRIISTYTYLFQRLQLIQMFSNSKFIRKINCLWYFEC